MTPQAQLAQRFAEALVQGQYAAAWRMMAPALAEEMQPDQLRARYDGMVDWLDPKPDTAEVINILSDWPDRKPSETTWVYVAIYGDDGSEAVAVVIDEQDGQARISQVEWGRP